MPWTRGGAAAAVALASVAGPLVPATGHAQTDVGLSVGFYTPVGALAEHGSRNNPTTYFQQRLQNTLCVGANVTLWRSSRVGFRASVTFSPSDVAVTDTTGTHDYTGPVLLASARVIYAFSPLAFKPPPGHRETPWSFYVGLGAGFANRSGAVWKYSSGLTSPALLFNLGVRTAVGARAVLRFDVEDYLSRTQFDSGLPTQTAVRTHNDIVTILTVAWRIAR